MVYRLWLLAVGPRVKGLWYRNEERHWILFQIFWGHALASHDFTVLDFQDRNPVDAERHAVKLVGRVTKQVRHLFADVGGQLFQGGGRDKHRLVLSRYQVQMRTQIVSCLFDTVPAARWQDEQVLPVADLEIRERLVHVGLEKAGMPFQVISVCLRRENASEQQQCQYYTGLFHCISISQNRFFHRRTAVCRLRQSPLVPP